MAPNQNKDTAAVEEGTDYKRALDQYTELGNEYRYRDILMVQEFGLSMVALGVVLGAIVGKGHISGVGRDLILLFATSFMAILSLHLRNTNQDRVNILAIRTGLAENVLKFGKSHLNAGGVLRLSAPRQILWFAVVVTIALLCWTVAATSFDLAQLLSSLQQD